jgi:ribosomal protein L11 methyltransferase
MFAEVFDRYGCPGTLQTDSPPSLSAYLLEVPGSEQRVTDLRSELLGLGAAEVVATTVPEEDWAESWKQYFKTRRIGERIIIRPTWEEAEAGRSDLVIVLDPGQAFGTGDHPTTRLCLELMQKVEVSGKTVADVGCGSGILSIAAVMLGASKVAASDLDAQSVEVSKENAALNGTSFECIVAEGFDALHGEEFDVVLSNIISATLIRLAPDAARHVRKGGYWIVSGIIQQNWRDVLAAVERSGFVLVRHVEEGEWVGATFRR